MDAAFLVGEDVKDVEVHVRKDGRKITFCCYIGQKRYSFCCYIAQKKYNYLCYIGCQENNFCCCTVQKEDNFLLLYSTEKITIYVI